MITIVDYGVGNIQAFVNIYKELGIPCFLAKTKDDLNNASKIILPGVGHFDFAMKKLTDSGMIEILNHKVLQEKTPVLGICVGMQMMAKNSDEGVLNGLGWFDAQVKKIDTTPLQQKTRLPHMGWNSVKQVKENIFFNNREKYEEFYFLHSFSMKCEESDDVVAVANYGDEIVTIVQKENIVGIQCHPEKSHQVGIQFLQNFTKL